MNQEKILVIQTAFLGDAILTLPMIQVLKKRFPASKIDVVAIPSTAEIFKSSPVIDNVIILDKHHTQRSLLQLLKFIINIRKNNYCRIYSPHRSFRTSLIVLLSKVKSTFGFNTASLSFVYKHKIIYEPKIHEVERDLKLIGFDNIKESWKIKPQFEIPDEVKSKIEKLLDKNFQKKIIAIAPGSVWATKKYPKEYYFKIIQYLLDRNFYVVLIGGTDDKLLCKELENRFTANVKSFAGSLSIVESIELINNCSLLICNDSAPTHMGMATNTPTLTIYCSTIPDFGFYPYMGRSDSISFNDLPCKPCGIHGYQKCPIKTFECGYKLLPEQIIEKINTVLG